MNAELFSAALMAALDAHALKQRPLFISAIRVAQSAIAEHETLCCQLELALQLFPAPEVHAVLSSVQDALAHLVAAPPPRLKTRVLQRQ